MDYCLPRETETVKTTFSALDCTDIRGTEDQKSIPVTRKERQLKKEEPHDKIELHLADVTTQSNRRFTMNYTPNHKIAQVTENTLVVGVDIGSEQHYAAPSIGED